MMTKYCCVLNFWCGGLLQESGSTGRQQEQRQSPQETGTSCVDVDVCVGGWMCCVCVYGGGWVMCGCVCVYRGGWVMCGCVWMYMGVGGWMYGCVFVWVNGWMGGYLCVWRWGGGQCGVYVGGAYVRVNIFGRGANVNTQQLWVSHCTGHLVALYCSMLICVWCHVEGASIRVTHVDIDI